MNNATSLSDIVNELMSEIRNDLKSGVFDSIWMGTFNEIVTTADQVKIPIKNTDQKTINCNTKQLSDVDDVDSVIDDAVAAISGSDNVVTAAAAIVTMETTRKDECKVDATCMTKETNIKQDNDINMKRLRYFGVVPEDKQSSDELMPLTNIKIPIDDKTKLVDNNNLFEAVSNETHKPKPVEHDISVPISNQRVPDGKDLSLEEESSEDEMSVKDNLEESLTFYSQNTPIKVEFTDENKQDNDVNTKRLRYFGVVTENNKSSDEIMPLKNIEIPIDDKTKLVDNNNLLEAVSANETVVKTPENLTAEYTDLLVNFEFDLVLNDKEFKCTLCELTFITIGDGVVLQQCLHIFCRDCLKQLLIRFPTAKCPYENCDGIVLAREKRSLLTQQEFNLCPVDSKSSYDEYIEYDQKHQIISNIDEFECTICFSECGPYDGITLRDCCHTFCLECIRILIIKCDLVTVECPYVAEDNKKCTGQIEEREILGILPKPELQKYRKRIFKLNIQSLKGFSQCSGNNCEGFAILEEDEKNPEYFFCNICNSQNCISCKAIHEEMTCMQYKQSIDPNLRLNNKYLEERKSGGLAMDCPACGAIVERIDGCDGMQCTICKTELCWATKGLRWGPDGKGDTSAGCRCNVNGKRCHPTCNNCH